MPFVGVIQKRQSPEAEARGLDGRYNAGVRRAFLAYAAILSDGATSAPVLAAIEARDPTAAVQALPWFAANRALQDALEDALALPLASRGTKVLNGDVVPLAKAEEFSATNRFSARWLNEHVADLVLQLTGSSRAAAVQYLEAAFTAGMVPSIVAAEFTAIVGLAENAIPGFFTFREVMLAQGLSEAAILRLATARAGRMLLNRAKLVGITEVVNAREQGALDAWRVGAELGLVAPTVVKIWVYVANADCPLCRSLDEQKQPLNQPFQSSIAGPVMRPTLHPNCMCTTRYETLSETEFAALTAA